MRAITLCWAFISLLGCGNDTTVPTDAGPPGLVSVQYATYDGFAEPERVFAFFLNADDSVVAIERADAEGRASAIMSAGGSLVVLDLNRDGANATAHYYLGVKPGDAIEIGYPFHVTPTWAEVQLPRAGNNAHYAVHSACGAGSAMNAASRARFRIVPGCSVADVFVNADSDRGDVGSFLVRDVDFTSGQIDFSAEVFSPGSSVTLTLQNPIEPFWFASSTAFVRAQGIPHWLGTGSRGNVYGDPIGSTLSVSELVPSVDTEQLLVDTTILNNPADISRVHVVESVAFTTDYTLDVAALGIPLMLEAATLGENGVITWQESLGDADWVRAAFRPPPLSRVRVWRVVRAPYPGRSEITLPRLPDEFANFNPQPGEGTEFFVLGISPGGYDAFRVDDLDGSLRFHNHYETGVDAIGERFVTSR